MDLGEAPKSREGIQVIARAAAVLRALKDSPGGLSLGQIAQAIGLPRSTVQRIVAALIEERLLISSRRSGGIRLGPALQVLAEAARTSAVELCRPFLADLMTRTGETVDLSVLRGNEMVFLDQVQGSHRLRAVSSVGEHFPLTTTANGRAALAVLDDGAARELASAEWRAHRQPDGWPQLAARLAAIRENGIAEDLEDHTEGISALGMAFRDFSGEVLAISVPIPSSRFAEQRGTVIAALAALRSELMQVMEA
jgi:DNA-binding IclR family transcriptional regulator